MSLQPADVPLLRHPPYVNFWISRIFGTVAYQMLSVAVGWQVYDLTHSPLALGLVGLTQFIPAIALVLVTGHVADRYDRRAIVRVCQSVEAVVTLALAAGCLRGPLPLAAIYGAVLALGAARAFEAPTLQALLPQLVAPSTLPRAMALSSSAFQMAVLVGPAIGGLLYVAGAATVYGSCGVLFFISSLFVGSIRIELAPLRREPVSVKSVLAGIAYIRRNPAILGAMTLDLFAVLFGGATAMLPVYARDILATGPWGLGLLRAAPAAGALVMALVFARHSIRRHAGRIMFSTVAVFGAATIVFGFSRSFPLSMLALAILGAADMVSVVIRQSLVQLQTPDTMRGRVSAVNMVFIGTSNQLGEFESGVLASWIGVVPSVVLGGVGTLAVVAIAMRVFPELLNVDRLTDQVNRRPA